LERTSGGIAARGDWASKVEAKAMEIRLTAWNTRLVFVGFFMIWLMGE
jgi:hypothetical protein